MEEISSEDQLNVEGMSKVKNEFLSPFAKDINMDITISCKRPILVMDQMLLKCAYGSRLVAAVYHEFIARLIQNTKLTTADRSFIVCLNRNNSLAANSNLLLIVHGSEPLLPLRLL